tara:strand:- start:564 stop:788 length:225 start_codon:yes stop_codon:yes gene_type:complete
VKITKEKLKQIIKEELSTLEEAAPRHLPTANVVAMLQNDAYTDGKIMIQDRNTREYYSPTEWFTVDGNIVIEVE